MAPYTLVVFSESALSWRNAALTVGLKSAVELAPVQAWQKCGSRAQNGHKEEM